MKDDEEYRSMLGGESVVSVKAGPFEDRRESRAHAGTYSR